MIKGFREFLFRGNVVDLAVALVMGLALVTLVGAFTAAFINPLIGLLFGGGVSGGQFEVDNQVFDVGGFINALITFAVTAAAVYFFIVVPVKKVLDRVNRGEEVPIEAPSADVVLLTEIRDLLCTRPTI